MYSLLLQHQCRIWQQYGMRDSNSTGVRPVQQCLLLCYCRLSRRSARSLLHRTAIGSTRVKIRIRVML